MPRDPPPEKNLFSHHTYHADCNHNGYGADYDGKVIKPHKIGQIADEPNSTLIKAAFLSYLPSTDGPKIMVRWMSSDTDSTDFGTLVLDSQTEKLNCRRV